MWYIVICEAGLAQHDRNKQVKICLCVQPAYWQSRGQVPVPIPQELNPKKGKGNMASGLSLKSYWTPTHPLLWVSQPVNHETENPGRGSSMYDLHGLLIVLMMQYAALQSLISFSFNHPLQHLWISILHVSCHSWFVAEEFCLMMFGDKRDDDRWQMIQHNSDE